MEHLYQEAAITAHKQKLLSRKDLFLLPSLSDRCLSAFISQTIMTASQTCTQECSTVLLFI